MRQKKNDALQLKGFLADCMLKEYVDHPNKGCDDKRMVWMQMGSYLYWQGRDGPIKDQELGSLARDCGCTIKELDLNIRQRLAMTVRTCKLDEDYVFSRVEDYFMDRYIGRWQRLVNEGRWSELAKKLIDDRRILDQIVEGDASIPNDESFMNKKCQIATNIRLTRAKYFKRLESPKDFELSKTVKAIERKKTDFETRRKEEFENLLAEKLGEMARERSPRRRAWGKLRERGIRALHERACCDH